MTKEMKDSGVEWIGEIPQGWNLSNLGKVSTIQTGNTPSTANGEIFSELNGIDWIKTDNLLGTSGMSTAKMKILPDSVKIARIAKSFSTLVCCIGDIGKLGFNNVPVAYNQQINAVCFEKEKLHWKYGMYSLFVQKQQHEYYSNGNVLKILNTENQKKIIISFPDKLSNQKKIVRKIDMEVSRIDTIISETEQSIEELKKYKQSLITEAVTKGLDKNVEMKDSGVEWIGETPKDWSLAKVNRLFSIEKVIANQTGYDILSVTQSGLKVKDITRNEGQMAADYSKYQIVQPGYFVMNHMDLLTGWVDLAIQEGVTSPDYRAFYAKDEEFVCNEFYLYVFPLALH